MDERVLPFDQPAALAAAEIAAKRRRQGITVDMRDTQIAEIAVAKRSTLATRNTKDFAALTIPVINPWKETSNESRLSIPPPSEKSITVPPLT